MMSRRWLLLILAGVIGWLLVSTPSRATLSPLVPTDHLPIYSDALTGGWGDWSWDLPSHSLSNATPVHGGSASIAVTYTVAWGGLQFGRNDALTLPSSHETLRFWIHGGSSGGQQIAARVGNLATETSVTRILTLQANTWTQVDIPLAELGSPATINYMQWQNNTEGAQSTFYLDDIAFIASGAPTPTPVPPGAGPALSVNVAADRKPISPYIYGMNFAEEALAADLRLPVRRWGGNATTRYNWQFDMSNRASDYFFQNISEAAPTPGPGTPTPGPASDRFVEQDRRTGTETLLTVPLIGWTPNNQALACGFNINKYGPQGSVEPWHGECGNGVRLDGTHIMGNDPLDTSIAIGPEFVQAWMQHLIGKYGNAANGGVRFYNLDNEPMLWNDTHRDVHPEPPSYDELRDRTIQYAAAIKATDPAAQTLGPAEWGWTGYFWSALDREPGGAWWTNPQDRLAHGNIPLVEWYLQQLRAYEQQNGTRLLDYLDLHIYPQANGIFSTNAGDSTTQALRLRSTRQLWDPTYVDESWIAEPVRLIPRMKEWVAANYPGTKLAIGEYSWGALGHISGALAQADVLGIFGREGVDLATLWGPPNATQPGAFAFRMYRNYDGNGSSFGETSVRATSADQEKLAIYAAERGSDGALTLMIINKATTALTSTVSISGFTAAAPAQVYRYSAANLSAIPQQPDQAVSPTGFSALFPASSITLVVIPAESLVLTVKLYLPMTRR